jgi:hypothetical protein
VSKLAEIPTASTATSTPSPLRQLQDPRLGTAVGGVDRRRRAQRSRHPQPVLVGVDHEDDGGSVELAYFTGMIFLPYVLVVIR